MIKFYLLQAILAILLEICFADFAKLPDKIVGGYWEDLPCESCETPPCHFAHKGGKTQDLTLEQVNTSYNLITVAYMCDVKIGKVPSFMIKAYSEEKFVRNVRELTSAGTPVMLSLYYKDADKLLDTDADAKLFAAEILTVTEKYGFSGLDVVFNGDCSQDNIKKTVVRDAIKIVVDFFIAKQQHFIVSLSPTFACLRDANKEYFGVWVDNVNFDIIQVQYFGLGNDGLTVAVNGQTIKLHQFFQGEKEDFLFYLTESIVNGTRGFISVPSDKLLIVLPVNADAAADGDVMNKYDLISAHSRLKAVSIVPKGLMAFNVNWDNGIKADGTPYNWGFVESYYDLIMFSGCYSFSDSIPIKSFLNSLPTKIFAGVWDNRCAEFGAVGKFGGRVDCVGLKNINSHYNLLNVGSVEYMTGRFPTFVVKEQIMYEVEFMKQMQEIREKGVVVLLSISSQVGQMNLGWDSRDTIAFEIFHVLMKFGFDGINIDFDTDTSWSSQTASQIISTAIRHVAAMKRQLGQELIVSISGDFTLFKVSNTNLKHFLGALPMDAVDIFQVRYYNKGNTCLAGLHDVCQDDDDVNGKENFILTLTNALLNGYDVGEYMQIPADKMVVELPSNKDSVNDGYVINSDSVANALKRLLSLTGSTVRGLGASSTHWEIGQDVNGDSYDWEFATRYGAMLPGLETEL
eukprot:GHVL01010749.1.p1 GENE.GHVL01010749.1~~GHVL01010749.1.p1  ORF type:complete len:686 (+),score=92.62 GHVL01010749.1:76-2133(+)